MKKKSTKNAAAFLTSKLVNVLKKKTEETKEKSEIEKLVEICVKILEYD